MFLVPLKENCFDRFLAFQIFSSSQFDADETNWLRMSAWNSSKENIILIHGYAGGDDLLPMVVLRDAYLTQGEYNVFVVDWSTLSAPPC